MSKIVMIIPAKSFSRRLPEKNMRLFCGLPLVAWSIIQAVNSKLLSSVWVTTDDDGIGAMAEQLGANYMIRDYQDTDETPGGVPIENCANRLVESGDLKPDDWIMPRLCTTPHLKPDDIDRMILQFRGLQPGVHGMGVGCEHRTFLFGKRVLPGISYAAPAHWHSHNAYTFVQHLAFIGICKVPIAKQFADPASEPNPYGPEQINRYYCVEPWQMQDVDTQEEFEHGELIMEHYLLKGRGRSIYDEYGNR